MNELYELIEKISFVNTFERNSFKKIICKREHFDGFEDLLFRLQLNGQESVITISGIKGVQGF